MTPSFPTACSLSMAVILSAAHVANGVEVLKVSPSAQENLEGDASAPASVISTRAQYLYPSSDFADIIGSNQELIGFSARADVTQRASENVTFQDIRITLYTTQRTELSSAFAENIEGLVGTVVHEGQRSFSAIVSDPPRIPNEFGAPLIFQNKLIYEHTMGNLLMDIVTISGGDNDPELDFQTTSAPALLVARNVDALTGDLYNGLQVRAFIFAPISDLTGDFNGNGILDGGDIDLLSDQVRAATNDPLYDLNTDTLVNDLDRQFWVHDLKQTFFGDADLNGTFDSTDLVQVLASGGYEDGVESNSIWLTGDWDGNTDFTSGDLVIALADGGYEVGAAAVPEPAPLVLGMTAVALMARYLRPKTRRL